MKKSMIITLLVGVAIGTGAINSFANEKEVPTNNQNITNGQGDFQVLNQETNQFEKLDDSGYRNNNSNYGQCCSYVNSQSY